MTSPASPTDPTRPESDRWGLLLGIGCYLMWGLLPLYFPLLEPAGALEVIAHRVVWCLVLCLALLAIFKQVAQFRRILRSGRLLGTLTVAAVLVAGNWTIYVFAVMSGHVLDASLGYFINPLFTVLLAVVFLKERLRPAQWAALGLGGIAVAVITAGMGKVPWISLSLALSFSLYGLIKNRVGREVTALPGLAVETAVLSPVALIYLGWLTTQGTSTLTHEGPGHVLLLMSAGVVTALPLLCFSAAARVLPLSVIGMLQYITPVMQFLCGVLVFHELMPTARWIGFCLVWGALVVLSADALRAANATRLSRAAARV